MYIKPFTELSKHDAAIAGGKGASLGEMTQAGIPVPPGFVVLAEAFDHFLREAQLEADIDTLLHAVKHDQVSSMEHASEQIRGLILGAKMPSDIADVILRAFHDLHVEFVAVRSSATSEDAADAAWAGQLESYLNTTEDQVLDRVKQCWASLFTPRAIFYRHEKQLHQHISVAVVVQAMVNSEVSGVAFSVHPVTQDRNQMVIEASYGLGEAIVSGQITPDSFVVEKEPRHLLEKNIYAKKRGLYRMVGGGSEWRETAAPLVEAASLTNEQVLELATIITRIENHYSFPCDIEWALEKGNFYIVQSRPITTLEGEVVKKHFYEKIFARDFSLPLIEAWCNAESTDPRQWTQHQQPQRPYIVFERTRNTVNCYMDPAGIEWVKSELRTLIERDPGFVRSTVAKFYEKTARIKPLWNAEKALSLQELQSFLRELNDAWPWFEAVWWLIEISDEASEDFALLKEARVATDRIGPGSDVVIRESLRKAFPELGKYSAFLRMSEILSNEIPTRAELERRAQGYIYTDTRLLTGVALEAVESEYHVRFEKTVVEGSRETLTGQVAYPGRARGKVRLVMGREAVEDLREGEVLVSSMTMPDFLPAMQKAVAFITDEGGITCHAAIMAREFKKPTVIGTKIATHVLRDGDEVEVDADTGSVRVLAHSQQLSIEAIKTQGPFERVVQFPAIPVIYFEAMLGCYERNPLAESLGLHYAPTTVYAMGVQLEGWLVPATKIQVTDQRQIEAIDREMASIERKAWLELQSILERPIEAYSADVLRDALLKTNQVSTDIYCGFIFFTDELLSPEDEVLTHRLQETRMALDRLVIEGLFKAYEILVRAFVEVHGLDVKIVERATTDELLGFLEGVALSKERLADRPIAFISLHGKRYTFLEDEAKMLTRHLIEQDPAQSQLASAVSAGQLMGRTGNKGKATGRVRMLSASDYQNQTVIDSLSRDQDYILVTPMTRPELVPYIKNASAFVTDEGGITCHAAIIAREMGKPCVIGTQFATRMLKEGDMVKVDADTGTVTLLK